METTARHRRKPREADHGPLHETKTISSKIGILSIICILFLIQAPALGKLNYEINAWDTKQGWVKNNIISYAEGDCIPCYFKVYNDDPIGTAPVSDSVVLSFDRVVNGIDGIMGFECCSGCGVCPSPNPLSCCLGGLDISSCPPSGTTSLSLTDSTGDTWAYTWSYTIAPQQTITLCWCARLSLKCGAISGANMQIPTSKPGTGTISIPTNAIRQPDLHVEKTASQDCNEITYTITYSNIGEASQINTLLVDTYDKAKVTPIPGSYSDGTLDSTAGTITWSLGEVAIGSSPSYTRSFKVKINDGGCTADTIENRVTINGDRTDMNLADNSFSKQITVVPDVMPPVIEQCPAGKSVECPDNIPAPSNDWAGFYAEGGRAGDNCDEELEASFEDTRTGSCPEIISRKWTVTDDCGNKATCTQTITYDDTTPPVIETCPPPITVDCVEAVLPYPENSWNGFYGAGGRATDTCDTELEASYVDVQSGTDPNPITITRTWTVRDDCENIDECDQIITITNAQASVVLNDLTTCIANIPAGGINLASYIASIEHYDSVLWTHLSGPGTLTNPDQLNAIFIPQTSYGSLKTDDELQLTVTRDSSCPGQATDTMTIVVYQIPMVEIHVESPLP